MTPIEIIRHHCIGRFDIEEISEEKSFLDKLRPFEEVSEKDFYEIVISAEKIYQQSRLNESIEKEVIYQLNGCARTIYSIGIRENSALRSNNLINDQELQLLKNMFFTLLQIITELTNPHDPNENGSSPLEIYEQNKKD